MMFTFKECFSSDCGHCSCCCKGKGEMVYISPYDDTFADYQDSEAKEAVKKAKELKKNKFRHLPIREGGWGTLHDILGNVMGVKSHAIYIPLDKRIKKVKEQIEENESKHRRWMEDFERVNELPVNKGSLVKRLPEFSPDGLPDLTPGIISIPYQEPDYNDKEVMKKIDIYRDQYWKDMKDLKNKFQFKNYKSIGTIPTSVQLTEKQYIKIKLPSDLTLKKGAKFTLLRDNNHCCDTINCLDMNSIYCAESRTLDIPIYTQDAQYEICGLCLLGK